MVKSEGQFLVDTAFIVERTSKTFFGTPLFTEDGKDNTFTFGFARDFLKLRRDLGMQSCVLLIGKEAHFHATAENTENLIAFLQGLGVHCISDRENSELNLVGALHSQFSHVVTADKRFLQLSKENFAIVLLRKPNVCKYDWLSPEAVTTAMGISPKQVPTYLALTAASKTRALYRKQAVDLIKLYENLDSIFKKLDRMASERIRHKLQQNEWAIRDRLVKNTVEAIQNVSCENFQNSSLVNLNNESNRQFLREYGFHSLVRLLEDLSDSPF
jgi:5''-3'' exonuclease (including N-terminal domain of PolI)